MKLKTETAAPIAVGNGGDISKAVTAGDYRTLTLSATEIASSIIAARFRLSPCMARLVCELAQLGGRLA
ncbi:hypothetical protein SAMN04488498_11396 [Mesorhizobium albiziae]|uniref:Uncharacterized protein n=1 Tax=Neomesorhizobium albiziae TaxID=335020 RepID=A0A1I4CKM0_9HYPH|nr:hypothetical protein [Mesorhizobium albiziae]GLS29293.1 hypothetical protein GCM10007937_10010 [Mesorhizobium albiziae]SFK81170.1 hypothetical protein SAMN04488498_11396 [Mesorhizobium albiziae]